MQQKLNEELMAQPNVQALFDEFKYDVEEERKRDIDREELEKNKRNKQAAARFED